MKIQHLIPILFLAAFCTVTAQTNNASLVTNGAAPIARLPRTPFASAIVDQPGVKMPEQGPWTISAVDLKYPKEFFIDLIWHSDSDPMFLFLWGSLSADTRSTLNKDRAKMGITGDFYEPTKGLKETVAADLNKLVLGKLIYDEKAFAPIKQYLSGDTLKLLNQPVGSNVTRLNRLLLEDAFPLDIMRRPKILFDSASNNFVFVDFAKKTILLYGQDEKPKWTADLGRFIRESRDRNPNMPDRNNNSEIWDVFALKESAFIMQKGDLEVRGGGNQSYSIDLISGKVFALPVL